MSRRTEAAQIAADVLRQYPSVAVVHLGGEWPDFIGSWFFRFDRVPGEVLMESPTGDYPFFIRTARDEPGDACPVEDRAEAVAIIGVFLDFLCGEIVKSISPASNKGGAR